MTKFPILPNDYLSVATGSVTKFINRYFNGYFDEEETKDLVQDVSERLWSSRDRYDSEKGTLDGWVWKITRNVIYSAAANKKRAYEFNNKVQEGNMDDNTPLWLTNRFVSSPEEELLGEELLERAYDSLSSERDRRFLAWKLDNLEAEEMARAEGISVANVYTILHRLKKRLEKELAA